MISVSNATKIYSNGTVALSNININISAGEFVFIVGSSGSGKSTLIKLLLKEVDLTEGDIIVSAIQLTKLKHKDLPLYRRNLGVVFQDFRLLPNKTVYDNIAFAMRIVEKSNRLIRRQVPIILSMIGLEHKASVYPNELSGGEQQRVALARAIANKPPILIADEPTGNLDPVTAAEIISLIKEINNRGTTVIVATHAKEIVDKMKKRVVTIADGLITSDVKESGYLYEN